MDMGKKQKNGMCIKIICCVMMLVLAGCSRQDGAVYEQETVLPGGETASADSGARQEVTPADGEAGHGKALADDAGQPEDETLEHEELSISCPRVNFMEAPQGLDSLPLWFSWEAPFEQDAYEITIEKNDVPVWQSGKVQSAQTVNVAYSGEELLSNSAYQFRITSYDAQGNMARSEKASFSTAYLRGNAPAESDAAGEASAESDADDSVFAESEFICLPDGVQANGEGQGVYGKVFEIPEGDIEKVWFYGSALGIYEAWINGKPVDDLLWKSGWTDYRKTLLYNTCDITEAAKQGQFNRLTVMVNNGWWAGNNAFGTYGEHKPAFIGEVLVCYRDGSRYRIGTDASWSCGTNTNVRYADFFQGETCDLRLPAAADMVPAEMAESSEEPGTGAAVLSQPVSFSTIFKGKFKSAWMDGVKAHDDRTFRPTGGYIYEGALPDGTSYGAVSKVIEQIDFPLTLQPGQTLLVDLGQNIAGIPEVVFSAREGTQLHLQFAEMLNDRGEKAAGNDGPAGSLYRANYRAAGTKVKVIASAQTKQEMFRPVFFFTGFRYLTVEVSETAVIHDLKGIGTGNAAPETGTIVTDNEKVNRLFENVKWSQRNNFTMIATDCPQRDERLGWMGDLQSFCRTSLYNQNLYSFYRKWEQDLVDAQRDSGAYTDTAPSTSNTGAGNAGWAEVGILVPWNVYRMYGNTEQLELLFDSMVRYMDYLEQRSDFENGPIGGGTAYGDWLSKESTDKHFLAALWYGEDALVMQKIAGVLGKEEDVQKYKALQDKITAFVREHYWGNPEKLSQTEMCFLLKYGFLEESDLRGQVEQSLQASVESHDYLLMTGFAGTPILLQTLTDIGRSDLAYRVLTAEGNPSWLYSVNQGATTIWERYDSYTLEKGFASAAMNSFDHFNEGSVAQWMYESMVGISVDMGRETPLLIKPCLPPEGVALHEVSGTYHSVYGEVSVAWKLAGGNVQIDVTIPMGARAEVILPVEGCEDTIIPGGSYHFEGKYK